MGNDPRRKQEIWRNGMGWSTTSRQSRGYGAEWDRARKTIIIRDKGLCQPCMATGRPTPYSAVDHITPKANGGTDDPDNLQCICSPCHEAKTTAETAKAQGKAYKPRPTFTADGRPVW